MAIRLNGSTDFYSFADTASWDLPDGDWIVGAWVKIADNSGSGFHYLVSTGAFGGANTYNLNMEQDGASAPGRWNWNSRDGTHSAVTAATATHTVPSDWLLLIVQRSGNQIFFWRGPLNGQVTAADSGSVDIDASLDAVTVGTAPRIGARTDGAAARFFRGDIYGFFKGDFALSAAEITRLCRGEDLVGDLGKSPDVYILFDTESGSGAEEADLSGNGNTGTANGTPVYAANPVFEGPVVDDVDLRVHQRAAGATTRALTLSGTYLGSPEGVEARVIDEATGATVIDWTACAVDGGDWSLSVVVPQGGWYRTEVRFTDDHDLTRQGNRWGVGLLVALLGQSNMDRMRSASSSPPAAETLTSAYYSSAWGAPAGNGCRMLANLLTQRLRIPVGLLPYGVFSTGLVASDSGGTWTDTASGPWVDFLTALDAVGGDCELAVWHQGSSDARVGPTSRTAYADAMETLLSRLLAQTGRTHGSTFRLFVAIQNTGGYTETPDGQYGAGYEGVRAAQMDVAERWNAHAGSTVDLALIDEGHWAAATYERAARRYAQSILHWLGLESYHAGGPVIAGADRYGEIVDVRVIGAETLGTLDGQAPTGFELSDDDFATTITVSAIEIVGSIVRLTMDSDSYTGVKLRYQWGMDPDIGNPLYDLRRPQNDAVGIPVLPTHEAINCYRRATVDELRLLELEDEFA